MFVFGFPPPQRRPVVDGAANPIYPHALLATLDQRWSKHAMRLLLRSAAVEINLFQYPTRTPAAFVPHPVGPAPAE